MPGVWIYLPTKGMGKMSITDMDEIENILDEITDTFEDKLKQLFEEVPEAFEDRSSQMAWFTEVSRAADSLREELNEVIGKVERQLHDGQFNFDV
jgi:hypothetical protein